MEAILSSSFQLIIPYILQILVFVPLTYFIWKLSKPLELTKETPTLLKSSDRIVSDLPPIYPNGWNAVIESKELSKNEIKSISMFGKDLIVFRGLSGKCYVFDAYCPHLGANLGIGGTIVGDSVRCPFHGWVFDQDGKCTHVPGIDCIKSMNAEIKKYDSIEINDYICVWYHSRGEKPDYFPENCQLIHTYNVYRGKSINIVHCHIQDIYENAFDFQHILVLHSAPGLLGNLMKKPRFYDAIYKMFHFEWSFDDWNTGTNCYENHFSFKTDLKLFGLTSIDTKIRGLSMGPTLLNWKSEINFFGNRREFYTTIATIQTNPMENAIVQRLYSKSGPINWFISRYLISGFSIMAERDAIVWSNKKYLAKPILAKNEPKIVEFRRWYKQFY